MWKIRHEGSPRYLDLTLEQIRQGLVDGHWEVTDEVMGPNETEWVAIENHPQLEELALDIEPPPPPHYDDETRLDMTALIDVCLVLLVFFILTTTVAALSVRIEAPGIEEGDNKARVKVVTEKDVEDHMIMVEAKMEGGKPVVRVEGSVVEMRGLAAAIRTHVKQKGKTRVLLDHEGSVPHEVVVKIIDAAKAVGVDEVQLAIPRDGK